MEDEKKLIYIVINVTVVVILVLSLAIFIGLMMNRKEMRGRWANHSHLPN